MSRRTLDIIGMLAMLVSFGAELLSDWIDEKSTEDLIDEKLDERGVPRKKK